jgi:hypothetical protein
MFVNNLLLIVQITGNCMLLLHATNQHEKYAASIQLVLKKGT